jgi:hypothetical protein
LDGTIKKQGPIIPSKKIEIKRVQDVIVGGATNPPSFRSLGMYTYLLLYLFIIKLVSSKLHKQNGEGFSSLKVLVTLQLII